MSDHKSQFARAIGTISTVVVLLAVPAFAISFADASIFSQPTSVDVSPVARATDDSTILANWQFTCTTRQVRHTEHVHHTDHRPIHHSPPHHSRHTHTHHASKHTGH
jgi:hypothetical protein